MKNKESLVIGLVPLPLQGLLSRLARNRRIAIVLALVVSLSACDGDAGRSGATAIIRSAVLEVGSTACPFGGNQTLSGSDTNGNGILDPSEVSSTQNACQSELVLGSNYASVEEGIFEGEEERSGIISFKGLPYTAPPIDDLRFASPTRAQAFTGLREAKSFSSVCLQPNGFTAELTTGFIGEEDCLYLNVFRPADDGTYPVLVWIHGGGLSVGSSSEPYYAAPHRLVDQGIVVITLNYRLGLLGFLTTAALSEEQANDPGNYGIKDQQAALAWIKRNAHAFDGDHNNITLFGESAGGHSILTLMASPYSEGLFNKAIVQSGAYLPNQSSIGTSLQLGALVTNALGCDDETECLRQKSVEEIFAIQSQTFGSIVLPTAETATLPLPFGQAFSSGAFLPLPLIIGTNLDEWTLFTALDELVAGDLPDGEAAYRETLATSLGTTESAPLIDAVTGAYPLGDYGQDVSLAYSAVYTDLFFVCDSLNLAATAAQTVPVFMYEFADTEAPNFFGIPASFDYGASHAFEIPYLFSESGDVMTGIGFASSQVELANTMVDYWTNFAKYGSPNSAGTAAAWPMYTSVLGGDNNMLRLSQPVGSFSDTDYATNHRCVAEGLQIAWKPSG